jgi:hypothetical protein
MDEEGNYPDDTITQKVIARLEEMAETQQAFNRPPIEEGST